jgi:hypothetical protein
MDESGTVHLGWGDGSMLAKWAFSLATMALAMAGTFATICLTHG